MRKPVLVFVYGRLQKTNYTIKSLKAQPKFIHLPIKLTVKKLFHCPCRDTKQDDIIPEKDNGKEIYYGDTLA